MKRLFIFLALCASLQSLAQKPVARLPFEIQAEHIHVKVEVDGQKDLTMAFDTGARANLIDKDLATKLGFEVSGRQQVEGASGIIIIELSEGHTMSVGEYSFQQEAFFLMELDRLSDEDHPIDGVIGGSILDRFVTEINFDKSEILLYDQKSFEAPTSYSQQKFSFYPFGIPVLTGQLNLGNGTRLEGRYLVDTGAALALSLNYPLVKKQTLTKTLTPNYPYVSRNVNSESTDIIGRLPQFDFLGHGFQGFPVRMAEDEGGVSGSAEVDGIIGLELLKRFNLIFDYSKQQLYFEPNLLYDSSFLENFSGLVVRKVNGQLTVEQVIDGSPAKELGLQEGDIVLAVDDQDDLSKFEFYEYVHPLRKEVKIKILREEEIILVNLKAGNLI